MLRWPTKPSGNQLGLWTDDDPTDPGVVATSAAPGAAVTETAQDDGASAFRVSFPQGSRATLAQNVYEIVGTRVERRNPGELALVLTMRMTNRKDTPDASGAPRSGCSSTVSPARRSTI